MIEPVLTVNATSIIDELLDVLNEHNWLLFIAIKLEKDDANQWYAFEVDTVRWLAKDAEPGKTVAETLELEQAIPTPAYHVHQDKVSSNDYYLLIEGDEAIAVNKPANVLETVSHCSGVRGGIDADTNPAIPHPQQDTSSQSETKPVDSRIVPVYFATDRNLNKASGPTQRFGGERDKLRYGLAEVRIPENHQRGNLESPKWWKLERKENPKRHVTMMDLELLDWNGFQERFEKRQAELHSKDVFLFVHGYNVSFDAAMKRTAQICWDLRFPGTCMAYSWPSTANLLGYTRDEAAVHWSEHNFKSFLLNIGNSPSVRKVHIMAHSMGNRLVTEVLSQLSEEVSPFLGQVILAAPDVDEGVFTNIAEHISDLAAQVTLYASSNDLALRLSKFVHGYRRAGDSSPQPVVIDPVVSIDASRVSTDLLGHSYIGDDTSILSDVYWLLKDGRQPQSRDFYLSQTVGQNGQYWVFNP